MANDFLKSSAQASPMPIGELLAYHAARHSARPAVTFNGVTTSYAELDARSNRKARQLAERGVGAGDIVTMSVPNSLEFYETVFAVWKLGAVPNLVSSKLPATELQAIIELAKPRLVISEESARVEGWNFIAVGMTPSTDLSADPLPTKISPIWKIGTSGGSTGRPKLIVDRQKSVFDPNKAPMDQKLGDTMLNPGPLYHNTPFLTSTQCLFSGGHVVEMGRFDPLRALELIERYKVNWMSLVPTMMSRIWRLPTEQREAFDLSSVRSVWHMASVCPVWLKQAWIDWLGPDRIFEVYGGTELMGFTMITGREWLSHKGSVGKTPPGYHMRILDEKGNVCAPGEVGEIYFLPPNGPNSTYEYIGAQVKAVDGWQTYGDLGHVDEEGYLYIADRRTDMIVSGGANIFPAEVEAAVDQHPDVQSSIVIGLPDADLGQRAHAIVQLAEGASEIIDDDTLRAFLSGRLARYKIPRTFEFTSENLRDDAGKARRSQLREDRVTDAS
ncbi:AMP-dependent synthetase and ligase [Parvibaculum lavamentivorans DS-1]|uniref:AMP-dependent synthetase and ligase n=1 Tax=Parvibaculum lavamentivorans (strain DS-1 / DSM 13023 / NCIMB 13966) TaxID=402881 RepID=A7HRW8_PARL1|nr:AMP-binding protein [Parvibaculum lavamentivorans]ABS62651.1 AMP-dependent synthetase and ligase [Parvibaculum lavamentivorans DS-1]